MTRVLSPSIAISIASSSLPAWVPAEGKFANVSLNVLENVNPCPANNCTWSGSTGGPKEIFRVWCGGVFAPEYGSLGGLLIHGGGHGSYSGNDVYAYDIATQRWVDHGTPSNYTETNADINGEYPDGKPFPPHVYTSLAYMPPAWGGGVKGSLVRFGFAGASATQWAHRMDLNTGAWSRFTSVALGGASYKSTSRDDSRQGWWIVSAQGNVQFVSKTGAITTYGGAALVNSNRENVACYIPSRDILVNYDFALGDVPQFKWLNCANPSAGWTTITTSGTVPSHYSWGFYYSTLLDKIVSYQGTGQSAVTLLSIPSVLSNTWVFSSETLTGVGGASPSYVSGNINGHWRRFVEAPAAKCFIWAESGNGPVQAWRLTGMN